MQKQQKYIDNTPEVFLFINSASGGGLGKDMLDLGLKQQVFTVKRTQNQNDKTTLEVTMHFFNLKNKASLDQGFTKLKQTSDSGRPTILVICGGDGSVMWVVTEMANYAVDHELVPIAIIPLGTGNDFAQTFGWGKSSPDLLSNDFQKLKKRITYWLNAERQNLDIWMVEAQVQPYGKFEKVQDEQPKVLEGKVYVKHFCNYFSIGVDGKIGFSFDLHRTSSRIGNLAVYGAMGLIKGMTKTKNIGELTEYLRQTHQPARVSKQEPIQMKEQAAIKESHQSLQDSVAILQQGEANMTAVANNENLLALNINSFMGGVTDIWRKSKAKPSLDNTKFEEQKNDDGKIEFISFEGSVSMGMQRTAGGFGEKVYQGSGPFELKFKQYPESEKHRTYLQIDGEFLRYTHPSKLTIRRSTLSKTGQIAVLRRVALEKQMQCCAN